MTFLRFFLTLLSLLIGLAATASADTSIEGGGSFRVTAMDPTPEAYLQTGDKVYVQIHYTSPIPVRFEVEAIRQGVEQSDSGRSSSPPYPAGSGEALVWLVMSSPIRTDEIRVTAYDLQWNVRGVLTTHAMITWEHHDIPEPREPEAWVGPLLKQHRRVFDSSYDPLPDKPQPLFDFFFTLSFVAIPGYLLMQAHMLLRYRGRWQWYAAAPLLPIIPMALYSLIGLGLSRSLWIKFLFHYLSVSLLYLLILWTVKWNQERSLRAAQRHQHVDATSGTE